jgi:hypothetical protein
MAPRLTGGRLGADLPGGIEADGRNLPRGRPKRLRLLAGPLAQLVQFRAQAMSQGTFRPKFVEELLGLG